MNETNRTEYLKLKRDEYKNRLKLEKKENALNKFLTELNDVESELVKVVSLNIDLDNIAKPNLTNKPEKPIYTELKCRTIEEESNVKNKMKSWVLEQKAEKILLKNEFLLGKKRLA